MDLKKPIVCKVVITFSYMMSPLSFPDELTLAERIEIETASCIDDPDMFIDLETGDFKVKIEPVGNKT